jgi:hypothetical protein
VEIVNIAARELVPQPVASAWDLSSPDEGETAIPLHPGYTIKEGLSKLDLFEFELSGVFGPTWVTVEEGSTVSVPCRRRHLFSWHYHPDGDTRLSVDDWITFLASDAWITLLITTRHAGLYVKAAKGRWSHIRKSITGLDNTLISLPNLWFLRFMKLMCEEMKTESWLECEEGRIAATLGIRYETVSLE